MASHLLDQRAMGTAVITRAEGMELPAEVTEAFRLFNPVHVALLASIEKVDKACAARDAALDDVGTADATLDRLVLDDLAGQMVGAKLGNRKNPFAGYSELPPAKLVDQAYLKEVASVRELAGNIAAKGPGEGITQLLGECLQQAAKVEQAIKNSSKPQRDYELALAARDGASVAWSKAFAKLKARAQLALDDQPELFKALFADPRRIDRPVTRRAKKNAPADPTETPADPK